MLWQKSPQYQDMPHEQYMQTEEGKRSQNAFNQWSNSSAGFSKQASQNSQNTSGNMTGRQKKSMNMSAYAPGRAQPRPPQNYGSPYLQAGGQQDASQRNDSGYSSYQLDGGSVPGGPYNNQTSQQSSAQTLLDRYNQGQPMRINELQALARQGVQVSRGDYRNALDHGLVQQKPYSAVQNVQPAGGGYDAWKQNAGVSGTPNLRQMQDYIAQSKRDRRSPMSQTANRPQQDGGYGSRIGKEGPQWGDFRDYDNDMTDDRYQRGPGQAQVHLPGNPYQSWAQRPMVPQGMQPLGDGVRDTTTWQRPFVISGTSNDGAGMPPSFNTSMTDQYGMPTTQEQYWPQQQAFVQSMLGRLAAVPTGTYLGHGAPPPEFGATPSMNAQDMWGQAGQAVQQGWQNPLAGLFSF